MIDDNGGTEIAYTRNPRDGKDAGETVTLEVTDANGMTVHRIGGARGRRQRRGRLAPRRRRLRQARHRPDRRRHRADRRRVAVRAGQRDRLQDRDGRARRRHRVRLARRERRGRRTSRRRRLGGWTPPTSTTSTPSGTRATAHSSGFTFKSRRTTTATSPRPTPTGATATSSGCSSSPARCSRDTNGTHDYFSRWGGTMDGLHMLNGFHTNAHCIARRHGRPLRRVPVPDLVPRPH